MPPPRQIGVVLVIALVIFIMAITGVFASLDGWLFDRLVRWSPSATLPSQGVLVVSSEKELEIPQVLELAENLNRQGARASVFARSGPDTLDLDTVHQLLQWNAAVTPAWQDLWGAGGTVPVLPPGDGIWRGVVPDETPQDGRGLTLKRHTADLLELSSQQNHYYLDFRVKRDGFQLVDAARLLGGDVPRSLVEGKVVLVGKDTAADALITTPIHRGTEALSPLLFQAAIIDALERGGMIRITSPPVQWSIAFVVAAFTLILLGWRKRTVPFWCAAGVGTLLLAGAAVALWQFQWWVPPAKSIVLIGAAGTAASVARSATQRKTLRRTLRTLADNAQERAHIGHFFTCSSPWAQMEKLSQQSFAFNLSFLLRLDLRDGTLQPVTEQGAATCGASLTQFSLHRDREPFSSAQRTGQVALPDGILILPLQETGSLFGFWVFQPADPNQLQQAVAFADSLASMLHSREAWRQRAQPHQLANDETSLHIRPLHDQLEGSLELVDAGRKLLAAALDRSMEAVLVYDPFGDLIHASNCASEILGTAMVNAGKTPPADLLARLTDADPAEIRRALRFVALNGEDAAFRASDTLVPGREFFVHVRPLRASPLARTDLSSGLPGLVVLIQDVTHTARAAGQQSEFVERLYFQLNNDFEAILAASALLDDERIDSEDRADLLAVINEKIEEAAGRMRDTRSHLMTEFSPAAVERYPIRFEPVFHAASAAVATELDSHQVTLDSSVSDYLQLVLAAPKPLEELLHAILLTLIHDSREESRLTIQTSQAERQLVVTFKNDGFGMPQDKLDRYLEEGADRHETLEHIGAGRKTVKEWGGQLLVQSKVGTGMTFELTLASVI